MAATAISSFCLWPANDRHMQHFEPEREERDTIPFEWLVSVPTLDDCRGDLVKKCGSFPLPMNRSAELLLGPAMGNLRAEQELGAPMLRFRGSKREKWFGGSLTLTFSPRRGNSRRALLGYSPGFNADGRAWSLPLPNPDLRYGAGGEGWGEGEGTGHSKYCDRSDRSVVPHLTIQRCNHSTPASIRAPSCNPCLSMVPSP
jgi:hypothetical protein